MSLETYELWEISLPRAGRSVTFFPGQAPFTPAAWSSVRSVFPFYSQKCPYLNWIVVMAAQLYPFAKNH